MTNRSPMHQQIDTLPALIRAIVQPFDAAARSALDFGTCTAVKRIYLVGCGDSHHAPVGAELAFNQLTGVPHASAELAALQPLHRRLPARHRA